MAICLESVVVVQVTCHCVHWIAQALGSQPRMIWWVWEPVWADEEELHGLHPSQSQRWVPRTLDSSHQPMETYKSQKLWKVDGYSKQEHIFVARNSQMKKKEFFIAKACKSHLKGQHYKHNIWEFPSWLRRPSRYRLPQVQRPCALRLMSEKAYLAVIVVPSMPWSYCWKLESINAISSWCHWNHCIRISTAQSLKNKLKKGQNISIFNPDNTFFHNFHMNK